MNVYQDANGGWIFFDGETKHHYSTEREARATMSAINVSERPLAEEFVETIVGEFLPGLRKLYLAMVAMQVQWQDEEFQAALATAALGGETLAGFPAPTWATWGKSLLLLQEFLEAPQDALNGATMRTILMRRYVAEVAQ